MAHPQQNAQNTQSAPTLTPVQNPGGLSTENALLAILDRLSISAEQQAQVFQAIKDANPPKVIDAITPEYLAKHPVPRLLKPAYQNGFDVNPSGLSDATITKLAELKTGHYLNGVVKVIVEDGGAGAVHLLYANKSPDQRMALRDHFRSFSELVDKIYAEQTARDAERERRRRD